MREVWNEQIWPWAKRVLFFRAIWMIIGAIFMFATTLFTGFWDFRSENAAQVRAQYEQFLEQQEDFRASLEKLDIVFEASSSEPISLPVDYSKIATAYIANVEQISARFDNLDDELDAYRGAISSLNRYYSEQNPPQKGTVEWVLFFGNFRQDIDRYYLSEDRFITALTDEVQSYWRYLIS